MVLMSKLEAEVALSSAPARSKKDRQQQQAARKLKKRQNKYAVTAPRLLRVHLAQVYASLTENLSTTDLMELKSFRDRLIGFLGRSMGYLSDPSQLPRLDLFSLRLHVCVIIARLAALPKQMTQEQHTLEQHFQNKVQQLIDQHASSSSSSSSSSSHPYTGEAANNNEKKDQDEKEQKETTQSVPDLDVAEQMERLMAEDRARRLSAVWSGLDATLAKRFFDFLTPFSSLGEPGRLFNTMVSEANSTLCLVL